MVTGLWRRELWAQNRAPWSCCCGSVLLLDSWCWAATALVVTLGGCTQGMLQEWPVLFAARNCVFILICSPRNNSASGRKRAQVLSYIISCVCLPAKVTDSCFLPFFYSILYFCNADEQFSDWFSIVCQYSAVFFPCHWGIQLPYNPLSSFYRVSYAVA